MLKDTELGKIQEKYIAFVLMIIDQCCHGNLQIPTVAVFEGPRWNITNKNLNVHFNRNSVFKLQRWNYLNKWNVVMVWLKRSTDLLIKKTDMTDFHQQARQINQAWQLCQCSMPIKCYSVLKPPVWQPYHVISKMIHHSAWTGGNIPQL